MHGARLLLHAQALLLPCSWSQYLEGFWRRSIRLPWASTLRMYFVLLMKRKEKDTKSCWTLDSNFTSVIFKPRKMSLGVFWYGKGVSCRENPDAGIPLGERQNIKFGPTDRKSPTTGRVTRIKWTQMDIRARQRCLIVTLNNILCRWKATKDSQLLSPIKVSSKLPNPPDRTMSTMYTSHTNENDRIPQCSTLWQFLPDGTEPHRAHTLLPKRAGEV